MATKKPAYTSRNKKSIGDQIRGGLRKAFLAVAATGVLGGTAYHNYGTINEFEAKLVSQTDKRVWEDGKSTGSIQLETTNGRVIIDTSLLHGQSQEDVNTMYNKLFDGRTYHFKTYGHELVGTWRPHVIQLREITPEELEARAEEKRKREEAIKERKEEERLKALEQKEKEAEEKKNAAQQQSQQSGQAGVITGGALSGYTTMVNVTSPDGKTLIQLTVPVEAKDQISVNSVTAIQPPAPAPKAPGR